MEHADPIVHQTCGLAVINHGTGLHMPLDQCNDLPSDLLAEDPLFDKSSEYYVPAWLAALLLALFITLFCAAVGFGCAYIFR